MTDAQLAKMVARALPDAETPRSRSVVRAVADRFGVTVDDLTGPQRDADIVRARWAAMMALRLKGLSYPAIGRALNRDHTTVLYAIKKMEAAQCSN